MSLSPRALLTITFLFATAATVATSSSYAAKAPVANDELLKTLENQFQNSRTAVISSEKRKRQVLSKLFHLNRKIRKIAEEKGNLSYDLLVLKSQARRIAKKVAGLELSIEKQKEGLNQRLRTLYKIRGQGFLRALFSAANPRDLERNMRFLSIVAEKDYELIQAFRESKSSLVAQRDKLKKKVRALLRTERDVKKSESELVQEQRKKSKLVGEIEQEKSWYLTQIQLLREKTKGVEIDERSFLSQSLFYEQKGKLIWPVDQIVVQDYGLLQLGSHGVQMNHKGIRFSSGKKSDVQSTFSGKVSFAGLVPGLGKVIVIDHSDHYYTVYGNLAETHVRKNEKVDEEQIIAESSAKGLYFEIRHYSQPENPMKWLRVRGVKVSSKGQPMNEG